MAQSCYPSASYAISKISPLLSSLKSSLLCPESSPKHNQKPSMEPSALQTFSLFPQLPLDIRRLVWDFAVRDAARTYIHLRVLDRVLENDVETSSAGESESQTDTDKLKYFRAFELINSPRTDCAGKLKSLALCCRESNQEMMFRTEKIHLQVYDRSYRPYTYTFRSISSQDVYDISKLSLLFQDQYHSSVHHRTLNPMLKNIRHMLITERHFREGLSYHERRSEATLLDEWLSMVQSSGSCEKITILAPSEGSASRGTGIPAHFHPTRKAGLECIQKKIQSHQIDTQVATIPVRGQASESDEKGLEFLYMRHEEGTAIVGGRKYVRLALNCLNLWYKPDWDSDEHLA